MTLEQFDSVRWMGGMKVEYRDGKIYDVGSVDFEEKLIGISGYAVRGDNADDNSLQWVRCENVTLNKL